MDNLKIRKLKKTTAKKVKTRLKYLIKAVAEGKEDPGMLQRSIASYKGILEHFNSYGFRQSLNQMFKNRGDQ